MRSVLLVLAATSLFATSAKADIYECTGSDGTTHYTNIRPRVGRCRTVIREAAARRAAPRTPLSAATRPATRAATGPTASDAERYARYDAFIREAATLYQLPEAIIRAVMRIESDFSADAISVDGAIGLMQLMPRTAASMGVLDPYDPRENILGGARYLRILANRFNGDLVLTIAAYNAGEGAVEEHGGVPPYDETRRYVERVLGQYYALRAATRS